MNKLIRHIKFRKDLGKSISRLRVEDTRNRQQLLKQKYLFNPISDYLLLSSMGGVASTALIDVIDQYSPYIVNPVIQCSIHGKLIDQKLKHLIRPLDIETVDTFPNLFKDDLLRSNFRFEHIRKAVFVIGDPSLSVLSLYRRNLAQDHLWNISQKKESKAPTDLAGFIKEGKDVFGFNRQLDFWLQGSKYYDCMILRQEALWDHAEEIARFCELSVEDLRNSFPKKERNSVIDEQYNQLNNQIFSELSKRINELEPIQIIKSHA